MNLWHESSIPESLVTTNAAMAKYARIKSEKNLTDAEMALWQLGDRIRVYFEKRDQPTPSTPKRAG